MKPADKGSAIVIMYTAQYMHEAKRQLKNKEHYITLTHSLQTETQLEVQSILTELHQSHITLKQKNVLLGPPTPRPCQFYNS